MSTAKRSDLVAISTRNLAPLPDVGRLRSVLQAMAMLDAILSPEWECRYHSFDAQWADGEQLGSMRNGSGDEFFALFNAGGCFLKGFVHESPMTPYRTDPEAVWPGVLEDVPVEFVACLEEPAFAMNNATFCIWRRNDDASWHRGTIDFPDHPDPDGSGELLAPLDGEPVTYRDWAEDYYERPVDLEAVRHVYEHRPLDAGWIARLNPETTIESHQADIQEIGYPGGGGHG